MRGYVTKGAKEATDRIKASLKVYPLAQKDNPPKTEFKNMSGLASYQTIMPSDFGFYESLNKLVQEETLEFLDPENRSVLAAILVNGFTKARIASESWRSATRTPTS